MNQLVAKDESNYDEDKILFYLNMSLKVLVSELDLNIKTIECELIKGVQYPFPSDLVKLLAVKNDNENINIYSYEYYANKKINEKAVILSANEFFSTFNFKAKISYSYFKEVLLSDTFINVPIVCEKALYYHTLMLAKEMLLSTGKSLEQAELFKQKYEYELIKCKNLLNNKHRLLKTRYKNV
ncbi:hypothetical protein AVCANL277_06620 [Campylobacter canadensis]|uniref:hypothetical protein n=1 Tax=Campylobacter canadensis TaxID=449520 RepID=UPI001CCE2CF7|nr:hypothetical protein [Campylobacter canadensis]MBZ7995170.1 hypothetical protein [Campylobacter canadensis]MBZ8000534.1 hypothetical protein [Campylobacter canadensis]MBZ8003845.1 hypothetical protein [Campylobacter canadensis]